MVSGIFHLANAEFSAHRQLMGAHSRVRITGRSHTTANAVPTTNEQVFQSNWWQFANGQTLTGAYKAPTQINANVAPVTIQFQGVENAIMTLPGGRQTALTRFRF